MTAAYMSPDQQAAALTALEQGESSVTVAVAEIAVPSERDRDAGDVSDLVESIQAVGLLHPPAVTRDLTLVAGLRRLTAVKRLGWERVPVTVVESLDDAVTALRAELDENTCRRDLSPVEAEKARRRRAEALAPLKPAGRPRNGGHCPPLPGQERPEDNVPRGKTRDVAATGLGYSGRRLDDVGKILDLAGDESQPEPVRQAAAAAVEALSQPGGRIDREKKKVQRAVRDAALAEAPPPDPASVGVFPVLYVDPPWRYEHASTTSREIENHYPTMSDDQLRALTLPAADDAVLLMWATSPKLAEALDLMRHWGFDYRTSMVWVKDRIGMGYYARQRHELLLIGRRGMGLVPDEDRRPDSVVEAARGQHSAKPHTFYDLIDHMWPGTPKVELFARNERPGWARWGNQA